jgi:Phosphotransferase enzyme family
MTSPDSAGLRAPWLEPAWLEGATAWIDDEAARAGLARDGEIEQPHVYWWATALRVPTTGGVLWFKASTPVDAFEPTLTSLLAALAPTQTVEVIATKPDQGWMLTRDAGVRLREVVDGPALEHWEMLLPRYAELQMELLPRRQELLAMQVPDHSLPMLPGQLAQALDEPDSILLGRQDGLTIEQHRQLVDGLPAFTELCSRLAALGPAATLQHDDFHDGNVFVRGGRYVFLDWGDACVSHPFHTLVVTLRALAYTYGLPPGGVELSRLRDAYLEPWTRHLSRADVTASAELARRTGTVQRALGWLRLVRTMPDHVRAEYGDSVPYGMRLYLLDGPFGTWDDGSF